MVLPPSHIIDRAVNVQHFVAPLGGVVLYHLLQRTHDGDTGVVHLRDSISSMLSLCAQGFAASSLNMDGKHTAVPTCVFCIAEMLAKLPQWRFLAPSTTYRRVIEENLPRGP